jgi:pSer/pThr/pTyr-binding forkhead associated (FHA) protein
MNLAVNLKEIESRLQALMEIDLPGILPGSKVDDVIIQKLASAIQVNTTSLADGTLLAPNVYTLLLHPQALENWQGKNLLAILLHSITTVAQEAGLRFTMTPAIRLSSDINLSLNDADVIASHRAEPMADTNATSQTSDEHDENGKIPENAFLIVEGVKVFPLSTSVINIGRRLDNQLIIDDPRVSRNHAQLRSIKGRFVVFDLNSTGGTFVNGQRTSQSVLYPGDVISLSGVSLIFGQDNPPPRPDLKETAPLQSATSDRPTALLKDTRSTAKFLKKE